MSFYVDSQTVLSGISATEQAVLFERVRMKIGANVVKVELIDAQIKQCLVEAIEEYSTIINNWALENRMAEMLGLPTSYDFTLKYVTNSLYFEESVTTPFSEAHGYSSPGGRELKKDVIYLTAGTQNYTIPIGRDVNDILWFTPSFLNPYGLDPSANIAYNEFGAAIQGHSLYTIMPVFDRVLSTQAAELRNLVVGSEYTYHLKNGPSGTQVLSLYPVPNNNSGVTSNSGVGYMGTPGCVYYEYYDASNVAGNPKYSGTTMNPYIESSGVTAGNGLVSGPSDAKLNYLSYDMLNTPSQTWVKKYMQALAKETLGYIRTKFSNIPIPDAEVQLNGDALLANAARDMEILKKELLDLLDKLSYKNMMENRAAMQDAVNKSLGYGSLGIFLG